MIGVVTSNIERMTQANGGQMYINSCTVGDKIWLFMENGLPVLGELVSACDGINYIVAFKESSKVVTYGNDKTVFYNEAAAIAYEWERVSRSLEKSTERLDLARKTYNREEMLDVLAKKHIAHLKSRMEMIKNETK